MGEGRPRVLPGGLAEHLQEAIRLNRSRRPAYATAGGRRASVLSTLLVATEAALLPTAWLLDRQARPFVRGGIPVLASDLVGFESLPPPDAPFSVGESGRSGVAPRASLWVACRRALRHDFHEAADEVVRLIADERARAEEQDRLAVVTVHLLESAGRMARRGASYANESGGATGSLTARLVAGHLALVPWARALDRWAAPLHRRGIGLFVNDLPSIPFDSHALDRLDR